MKRLVYITLFGCWLLPAAGQDLPLHLRQQLEDRSLATDAEIEDDALLQQLAAWQQKPLNLNDAKADDLRIFPFLTELQVHAFLQYRRLLGPLIDIHELQSIPGWDLATVLAILPYVRVGTQTSLSGFLKERFQDGRHQLLFRTGRIVQKAKGYTSENGFAGDPHHLLLRYQYWDPKGLQWGFTTEKDAGEVLAFKNGRAPFASAHLFARNMGKIKALALGDFAINLGQGLVHWQSLAFGKGPMVTQTKRQGPVLRPYASAGEVQFLRGAGITLQHGAWETTLFASRQKIQANTDINETGTEVITSLGASGLYRTAVELTQKNAAIQQVLGASLQYRKPGGSIGFNAVQYHFSFPIEKRAEPYNLFALAGNRFLNLSAHYDLTVRNLHLFGELASNQQGKGAWVQGMMVSIHPKIDLALHGRIIGKAYTAIAAQAFAESASTVNEQGLYTGLQIRVRPDVQISAYADVFRFPWLRYRIDAPSVGSEYLLQATYQPNKGTQALVRFRTGQKAANSQVGAYGFYAPVAHQRQQLQLQLRHSLHRNWQLRSRAELVWLQTAEIIPEKEHGFLWMGELQYHSTGRLGASAGAAIFETTGYNSRIYVYEADVAYSYGIAPLFEKGSRTYLLVRWKASKWLSVWGRVAYSIYPEKTIIGTGLMELPVNRRTEFKLQWLAQL